VAARSKNAKSRSKATTTKDSVSAHEKIARLLGVLATKDMEQVSERVVLLRGVGFEVPEVASILGMTENHVRVAAHHGRKKHKGKNAGSRKKPDKN
jgi:DNA-directed RNA polymerase specialized sigma24 family protein